MALEIARRTPEAFPQGEVQMLQKQVEDLFSVPAETRKDLIKGSENEKIRKLWLRVREGLNIGAIKSVEKNEEGEWQVHPWVRQAAIAGIIAGDLVTYRFADNPYQDFSERDTLPPQDIDYEGGNIRKLPGALIRDGSRIENNTVFMNGAFVNVGGSVGEGTMIDSNGLVGSLAYVGKMCHVSMNAGLAGVLEPFEALPNIAEDASFMGAYSALTGGVVLGTKGVLAPGTKIHRTLAVIDEVHGKIIRAEPGKHLKIPDYAVVVPGNRYDRDRNGMISSDRETFGFGTYTPVIKKYRDEKTDAETAIEEALRIA